MPLSSKPLRQRPIRAFWLVNYLFGHILNSGSKAFYMRRCHGCSAQALIRTVRPGGQDILSRCGYFRFNRFGSFQWTTTAKFRHDIVALLCGADTDQVWLISWRVGSSAIWSRISDRENWNDTGLLPSSDFVIIPFAGLATAPGIGNHDGFLFEVKDPLGTLG